MVSVCSSRYRCTWEVAEDSTSQFYSWLSPRVTNASCILNQQPLSCITNSRTFHPGSLENLESFLFSQTLISREKKEGRRLVSSIESLTFSVTSEDDLVITVRDAEGWQLNESASQLVNVFFSPLFEQSADVTDMSFKRKII